MASVGYEQRQESDEVYTALQVESVLGIAHVEVSTETHTHFIGYCPFHDNRDTPALAVDKEKGLWYCFNPDCGSRGTLESLLERQCKMNPFQAKRAIAKKGSETRVPLAQRLKAKMNAPQDFQRFPQEKLDELHDNFWESEKAARYMTEERGFNSDTIDFFKIGYSEQMDMVTVPMHDPRGMPIGLIGRRPSNQDKQFKNSTGLPKSKTLFNLHRAKAFETVYITEASFDGMSIYQATGEPNFVSTLGGHISPEHFQQLERFFTTIVIMTDADEAGRKLGRSLLAGLRTKKILWGVHSPTEIFPGSHKDANSLLRASVDDLRTMLNNPMGPVEYDKRFAGKG